MLYRIISWIAQLAINSYFLKVVLTGRQHVLHGKPIIFVANHPSAFMDPMVVAAIIGRPIHFLAAAEFFGKGFKAWFYQNQLNMIPVYRPTTLPGEVHKNDGVFIKCHELLRKGGAVLVFPEGDSITENRIRKLKTGVARMALGAMHAPDGLVPIEIIPIGLNYANPHRFQSDLFINIGKPISTNNFINEKSDVIRLTEQIETALKETVLHIQHEELDPIIKKVDLIIKWDFQSQSKTSTTQKANELLLQQRVAKSIQYINETQPERISKLDLQLDLYLNKIKNLGISDSALASLSMVISALELIRLIFASPLFFLGYAINWPPYYATLLYFWKLNLFERDGQQPPRGNVNPAFKGSIAMSIGIVFFILFYLVLAATAIFVSENVWLGIGLPVLFYLSGLFAMKYIGWFLVFQQKLKLRRLVSDKRELFASLIIERKEIINELGVLIS